MTKKNKIRLMSILISLGLSLTGCNNRSSDFFNDANYINIPIEESLEPSEIMPEVTEDTSTIESNYIEQLNSIDPEFNHENYYYDMDYLRELLKINNNIEECSYTFNGNVNDIVNQIIINTSNFVKNNAELSSAFDDNYKYREAITKCLNNIITNCSNDLNSDFHQISNMAVVLGSEEYFSQMNDSTLYLAVYEGKLNIIVINKDLLENIIENNGYSEDSYIYYVISHEINHTRQNVCPCNEDYEYSNINYTHDGYSFLMEASAESDLYNTRDFEDILLRFSYQDERKCEGELFLLSILNKEDSSEYYNAIYNVDYESFFNFFNLTTDEEKLDFLRIIESIDAQHCRNNMPYNIYNNVDNVTYSDLIREVGFTYKELLLKKCLINLIKYTEENSDFSLQDNLVILNIIKSYLIDKTYTYNEDDENVTRIYDTETISNMINMENIYINYLVEKYNVTEESIREYESLEVKVLIGAIMAISEMDEKDYGVYTSYAEELISRFPMIIPVLRANGDYSYNTYEEYILNINK